LYALCSKFENYQALDTLAKKPPNYGDVAPLEQTKITTVVLEPDGET
jgi:hypothetical protein